MKHVFLLAPLLLVGCSQPSTQTAQVPASQVTLKTPPPESTSTTSITTAAEVNTVLTQELTRARQNNQMGKAMEVMAFKSLQILDEAQAPATCSAVKDHWLTVRTQANAFTQGFGAATPDIKTRTELVNGTCRWVEIAADARKAQLGEGAAPAESYDEAKTQALAFAIKIDAMPPAKPPGTP